MKGDYRSSSRWSPHAHVVLQVQVRIGGEGPVSSLSNEKSSFFYLQESLLLFLLVRKLPRELDGGKWDQSRRLVHRSCVLVCEMCMGCVLV